MQSKFSSRSRAWADTGKNAKSDEVTYISKVQLRIDHQLVQDLAMCDTEDRVAVRTLFQDIIEVHARGLYLELTMTSAIGLADFIEDEILPEEQIPLHLELDELFITLIEDRPPSNITSPGAVPLHFHLDKLDIDRGTDGEFHVKPRKVAALDPHIVSSSVTAIDDEELRHLRKENTSLRARVSLLERTADEARILRRARDEADSLRTKLTTAQDDIVRLLDDKHKLLDELRRMRDHMQGVQQISHAAQTTPSKR